MESAIVLKSFYNKLSFLMVTMELTSYEWNFAQFVNSCIQVYFVQKYCISCEVEFLRNIFMKGPIQ